MPTERATGTLDGIGRQDHEETSEYRIFGPPGCGKTTNLTRQIHRAVEKYGPGSVLVTSFSRAAAAELAGRDLPIAPDRIGTLHAHCYHALGAPEIAEANVEEWNRDNPSLAITPVKKQGKLDGEDSVDDDADLEKDGDRLLQQLSRFRSMQLPQDFWPPQVRAFAPKWEAYKRESGLLDFTDLIDTCCRDVHIAPQRPAVIFADEAQDLNRMQLSLIRKWGRHANYFIVAGDDDQTIYTFTGAQPEAILDPDIPADHKIILKQSYRVPRAVHELAENLIRQVQRRQEKIYLPRDEDGKVERLTTATYRSPDYFILESATKHLEAGKSVMLLTACSYMLRHVTTALRKAGIPFHNPYRKSNGYWNPIRFTRRGSSANRVISLLVAHPEFGEDARPWTHGDLALWTEWLVAKGILRHGVKKKLQSCDLLEPVTQQTLNEIFEPGALESLLDAYEGDAAALLEWWQMRVTADVKPRLEFPIEVAKKRGPRALLEPPKVVVGTIHSVKGGEADVVYLFPDLSQAGDAQYSRGGAMRDAVIRVFYVGATRARETLYICQRSSALSISI